MPEERNNKPRPEGDGEGNRGRKTDMKVQPPPVHTFAIWIMIIFAIPLLLYIFKGTDDRDELNSSEFEALLVKNMIRDVLIKVDPGSGSTTIVGDYTIEDEREVRLYKVPVIYTDRLDELIVKSGVKRRVKTESNLLRGLLISILPIVLLVIIIYVLFARQIRNAGKGAIQFGKSRARLSQLREKVTFADVAGIQEAKEEVEEIIDFLKDPDKFRRLGGQIPRGVLMVGPPGTGKTLLARGIAGEADVPFFNISGSDFVEMFVGVGASRVRDMFEQGKKNAPCIIFIDEIDAVGRSRFSGIGGGHDEREQTLNALLVEMDGFEGKSGVIVIAATNRPDVLDPALLRPGRFDRQINIDLPDVKGRLEILNVHAKKVKMSEEVDLTVIARGTPGFCGADLANLINEAALLAARVDKKAIAMADLEEARDKVCWGKERRSRIINEHEKAVTAYHEAGHALVGLHCEKSTPLHKVTIIPRGNAYLGATMNLPEHDRYTQTRTEVIDELTVLMGGRCAEEIIFEDITSGASMDFKQASNLARRMVCEWGMSDKMGLLNYGDRGDHIYLGRDITRSEDYSEITAREIDMEIRGIINHVHGRARQLLDDNEDQLRSLGQALLEQETMDAVSIKTLLGFEIDEPEAAGGNGEVSAAGGNGGESVLADGDHAGGRQAGAVTSPDTEMPVPPSSIEGEAEGVAVELTAADDMPPAGSVPPTGSAPEHDNAKEPADDAGSDGRDPNPGS